MRSGDRLMSGPVRVIALGGTERIGKNMLLLEQRNEILIIDAGVMFPDETLPGVDIILPDMTYVLENRDRVVGLVLTHGHEDHIGAVPYLLEQTPLEIYGTPLTLGLLNSKLQEFRPRPGSKQIQVRAGESRRIGSFQLDFLRVNHSIPDGLALGVETDQGLIVHTSDFKFDQAAPDGQSSDFHKLAELGSRGVILMITDCTNAEREGYTPSEREVTAAFRDLFRQAEARVIVTTFASNVGRIQQVVDVSKECGRRVAIEGRSMERIAATAQELGYLHIPQDVEVPVTELDGLPRNEVTILTTGSQGEPLSALSRIAEGRHKQIKVEPGDMVIMSASPIPGNETLISSAINSLLSQGAHVIYGSEERVHVSGHASQEELKLMLSLVDPTYVVPTHGELRHMVKYRDLAATVGIPPENVFLLSPGEAVEIRDGRAERGESVPAGAVNVDGLGVGDVGEAVIRDRLDLSRHGIFMPVLVVDAQTFEPLAPPDAYSRGFIYMKDAQEIVEEANTRALEAVREVQAEGERDLEVLKARVKSAVRKYPYALTERRPIVLPIITPVGEPPPDEGGA
jgi:ribonuclease J